MRRCGAVVVVAGMLVSFGTAPVAMATAEEIPPRLPIEAFAKLPRYQDVSLSQDGKYLAYILPVDGQKRAIIQPTKADDGPPGAVPLVDGFDVYRVKWASADRLLVSLETFAQSIGYQRTETRLLATGYYAEKSINVVRYKATSAGGHRPQGQIQTQIVDYLADDPNHILMALDPDRNGVYSVVKVNIWDKKQSMVQRGKRGTQDWISDQQGVPRLGYGYKNSDWLMHYRDPALDKWRKLDKTEWHENGFTPFAFMEDPRFAYAVGPIKGRRALVRLDLVAGEVKETLFAHDKVDIDDVILDETGRRVVGVSYTEHYRKAHYFDDWYAKIQATIDHLLPDTVNTIVEARIDRKIYLIHTGNDREPGDYHVLDLNGNQLYYLASEQPGINAAQMARTVPVSYAAQDGLEIPAYLTLPVGRPETSLPTVLLVHGGPQSRTTGNYRYMRQFLANRGYAVLEPNFRGSSGYGYLFEALGEKEWGGAMQDDLTDAAKWLIAEGIADPERLCIVGGSYGGYAALMGAVKTPDLFTCAASYNGVTNLPALADHDRGFIGGTVWSKDMTLEEEGRRAASPHHQADRIRIPIFVAAAKDDARIPFAHSRSFYRKIRKQVSATFVELEKGGHSLDREEARVSLLRGLDAFLAEHLGPDS